MKPEREGEREEKEAGPQADNLGSADPITVISRLYKSAAVRTWLPCETPNVGNGSCRPPSFCPNRLQQVFG